MCYKLLEWIVRETDLKDLEMALNKLYTVAFVLLLPLENPASKVYESGYIVL